MENCRLRVIESDEAMRFEMSVNAVLADLERDGCAYEVAATVDGYFYKAVIKHAAPGVAAAAAADLDSGYDLARITRCRDCSYYAREYGRCSMHDKPVKFAGAICGDFSSEARKI